MDRNLVQIVRGRAIGIGVAALIGLGWAAWGLSPASDVVRILIGVPGVVVVCALLIGAHRLIVIARDLPQPARDERSRNRRVWTLFWINFVVEIVLLNVAVTLLSAPALRIYWIPAISFVVGLHFVPMAVFFRVPSYFACAAAMVVASAAAAVAIAAGAPMPAVIVAAEALVNAVILWTTAAWGLKMIAGRIRPLRDSVA